MSNVPTFEFSRQALVAYNRSEAAVAAMIEAADTNQQVDLASLAGAAALDLLRVAFWADTQGVNNWSHARHVDVAFIRKCVG